MTIALTIICILLTISYIVLMFSYRHGWRKQKEAVLPVDYKPSTFISVIIPARNEAGNIGACIDAILAQRYPAGLYEIMVIDDHSEDATASIVKEYTDERVHYISLADHIQPGSTIAYKKAAIATGIAQSKGTLIVTTDADCTAPNAWLLHIAATYEQETPVMIVAPVIYTCNHSLVQIIPTHRCDEHAGHYGRLALSETGQHEQRRQPCLPQSVL